MRGLLRKDWYVIRKMLVFYTVLWAVLAGMMAWVPEDHPSVSLTIPLLSANMVMMTIDSDERWRWDRFAGMLPLWPWQIVLAKYLLAYGVLALIAGTGLLAGWVSTLGKGGMPMGRTAVVLLLEFGLWLPLRYRFGRGKSLAILMLLLGSFAVLLLNPWGLEIADFLLGWMESVPEAALALGGAALLAGMSAVSYCLAVRFYTRGQRLGEN